MMSDPHIPFAPCEYMEPEADGSDDLRAKLTQAMAYARSILSAIQMYDKGYVTAQSALVVAADDAKAILLLDAPAPEPAPIETPVQNCGTCGSWIPEEPGTKFGRCIYRHETRMKPTGFRGASCTSPSGGELKTSQHAACDNWDDCPF